MESTSGIMSSYNYAIMQQVDSGKDDTMLRERIQGNRTKLEDAYEVLFHISSSL